MKMKIEMPNMFSFDPENEDEVMFARYTDDGHLEYVEDEEEQKEAEEVFNTFNFEEDNN